MEDELTFVIESQYELVSFSLLSKSLQDIIRVLRGVDRAMYGSKSKHEWMVSKLSSSAPTITVQPDRKGRQAAKAVSVGLSAVTDGTDRPPEHFSEEALVSLQKMRRLFVGKDKAQSITVSLNGQSVATIQRDISEKVNRILDVGYTNIGTLEGTLEIINIHGNGSVTIWDRMSRSPVRCDIRKTDELIDHVKSLLGKRVMVTGDVRYFINGVPRSISNVTEIEDTTPNPQLPRAGFGSIPDPQVRQAGAAKWLNLIRERAET